MHSSPDGVHHCILSNSQVGTIEDIDRHFQSYQMPQKKIQRDTKTGLDEPNKPKSGDDFPSLPCESFMKSIGYYRRHKKLRRKLSSNYWSDRFSFVTATCSRVPLFDQVCQIQGPSACANHLSHSACPRLFRSMAGSRAVSIVIASILQRRGGE